MKVKLLSSGVIAPKRVNENAAGYDLFAPEDIVINPGRNIVPMNFSVELGLNTEGTIRACSGNSVHGMKGYIADIGVEHRYDADVITGIVDCDYRGVVGVIIKSNESKPFLIKRGTKIAQMVVQRYICTPVEIVSELTETDRGTKGFGQLKHEKE